MLQDKIEKLEKILGDRDTEILELKKKNHAESIIDWKIEKAVLQADINRLKEDLGKRDVDVLQLKNEIADLKSDKETLHGENNGLKEVLKKKDAEILELKNNVSSLMIEEMTDIKKAEIVLEEMIFFEGEKRKLHTEAEKFKNMVEGFGYNLGGRLTLYTGLYTYASPKSNANCSDWEAFEGLLVLCCLDVLLFSWMKVRSLIKMLYRQEEMRVENIKLETEGDKLRQAKLTQTVLPRPSDNFFIRLNRGCPTGFHRADTFQSAMEKPIQFQTWWHILFSVIPFVIFVGITISKYRKGSEACQTNPSSQTENSDSIPNNVLFKDAFPTNRRIRLQVSRKFFNLSTEHDEL